MTMPPYCCGKCPELARGGYDCTCLYVKDCPKRKELGMLSNMYWRFSLWWGRALGWAWQRKRHKEYMRKSYPWKGQDD